MSNISPLMLSTPLPYQTYTEEMYDNLNVGEVPVDYFELGAQYGYSLQTPFDQSYQVPSAYWNWTQDNYVIEHQQYEYAPPPFRFQDTSSNTTQFDYQTSLCTYNNYYDHSLPLLVHQDQSHSRTEIPLPVIDTLAPVNFESNPVSKLSKAEDLELQLGIRKPFISKLVYLLKTTHLFSEIIQWSADGSKFIMAPSSRFTEVLIEFFAHSSESAFTRQLNTYGFRRLSATELALSFPNSPNFGVPIKSLSAWEHKSMHRDHPTLANTMIPTPSKARILHALKKKALLNKGTVLPRKIRMSVKKSQK